MRIYKTDNGMWVQVTQGGMGSENSYIARTNHPQVNVAIRKFCEWTSDINIAQSELDDLAEQLGLVEVELCASDRKMRELRFIKFGGQPHLPRLFSLERRAIAIYSLNGHSLEDQWQILARFDQAGRWLARRVCQQCGAWVQVDTHPAPNGIELGGPAVVFSCTNYLKLKETYHE